MEAYKQRFIEFMVSVGALKFGEFTLKSGRKAPFFINTGCYHDGALLWRLGQYYAQALVDGLADVRYNVLFGPAYKGIPLVSATAIALAANHEVDVGFAFDRKEAKSHGEGGNLIGHPFQDGDRVVLIDDVVTSGTSVRASVKILQAAANVQVVGLIVSVDRQERGLETERSALIDLRDTLGIKTIAIVTIDEIVAHLHNRVLDDNDIVLNDAMFAAIQAYRQKFGAQ